MAAMPAQVANENKRPESLPPDTSTAEPGPTAVIRVGLVEDDSGLRRNLAWLLGHTPGFECACASASAEEALKQLPRAKPDVVLMDVHLPNRSGIECTALLKEQLPELRVIMLTVYEDTDTLFKALRAGACGYLLKRALPEEVLEAIREVQRGGAPMTSEIARKVVAVFQEPAPRGQETAVLSRREQEILDLLLRGFANKEIAAELSISLPTVKIHLQHIYAKLHVRCRTDVMLMYMETKNPVGARPRPPGPATA